MRWRVAGGCWLVAVVLLLAVALAASAGSEAALTTPSPAGAAWWAGLAIVTLQAVVLLRPATPARTALLLVAVGAPLGAVAGLQDATGITSLAVLVATFLAVLSAPVERTWPALAGAAALVGAGTAGAQLDAGVGTGVAVGGGIVQGVGTVGAAVLVGTVVRYRRDARAAVEDRARAVAREQAALTEVAVARERTAMARELHDIAAHHLSGITVMTGAIARQIDTDPEGAKRAVREVRAQSTEMLRDLRRLVGLLRDDLHHDGSSAVHEESLAGVADLVEAARRTGTEVTLTVHEGADHRPPGAGVGPLAQLSAYRTVQEALANAARHAPGARCEVVLDARDAEAVLVTVRNGAPTAPVPVPAAPGGGFGLVGMRERAELTGARLDVGPARDGGWVVALRLPVDDPVAEPTPTPTPEEAR